MRISDWSSDVCSSDLFSTTLPVRLVEQAEETLKSEYSLEFLGLAEPVRERELENKMIEHIRDVLLALGYGFAYMGNQYKIKLGKNEYYIDLLFYHRYLQCMIAVELRLGYLTRLMLRKIVRESFRAGVCHYV